MHILIDCRAIHRHMGGIGRMALQLSTHIGRNPRGHHISVLIGADPPADLSLPGTSIIQADAAMIDEPFEQLILPDLISDLGADIYLGTSFSIPALRTNRTQISIIHDVVFEDHPEWVEPRLRDYLQRWARFTAEHADHVITVSAHAKARIQSVYGTAPARVSSIANGIPAEEFRSPSDSEIETVRRKFGLSRSFLLYLGTIEPKKGLRELLQAFAALLACGFPGDLVLAGGIGSAALDLDQMLSQFGLGTDRVRMLGYIAETDRKPLIAAAELFVYPSLYEGFGLPPLEAMAVGTPCLTSDSTSLPEVAGPHAIAVNVTDSADFLAGLRRGLEDQTFRRQARSEGPSWARRFSWDASAERYLDICEALRS